MCRWGWGCFFVGGWGAIFVRLQDCGSVCSEFTLLTDVSLMVGVLGRGVVVHGSDVPLVVGSIPPLLGTLGANFGDLVFHAYYRLG